MINSDGSKPVWGERYWTSRYQEGATQWDVGAVTRPLKEYFDQLDNKQLKILIPGAGNAYEAEYLFHSGFNNVWVVDVSRVPLANLKNRVPQWSGERLVKGNFFNLTGEFDLIIEQTFFCSLHPTERPAYAKQCCELLKENGKLVGVLFEDKLFDDHPPYGGFREDYRPIFEPYFQLNKFERCYNSIKPRQGRELFINLRRK